MGLLEILLKFCAGGTAVVVISWLAKSKNPTLAGLFVLFPAVTLVSFIFMLIDKNTYAIKRAALGSIYYIPSTLAFLITFYFAYKIFGNFWSLIFALVAWIVVAILLTIINAKFLHI